MVCCVCKKKFIKTKTKEEYYEKKMEFDKEISMLIDSLTYSMLEEKNDEIWNILLNYEALLLMPNYTPFLI
jgi:hypothetical protein